MFYKKKVSCIIPARLQSSRFPKKILSYLGGRPLLQWVWEAAHKTNFFDDVVFAIDSSQTACLIEKFNGKFLMTSIDCLSGTERLVKVMESKVISSDIWVNWQADEPFISKEMISCLLKTSNTDNADVWTLKKRIYKQEDINNSNVVKVICDNEDFALYFSRAAIPFYCEASGKTAQKYYKHIGIYAYTNEALEKIASFKTSYLENAEKLEQLSFLANKLSIKVHETDQEVIGIDTPQDLEKAEKLILEKNCYQSKDLDLLRN